MTLRLALASLLLAGVSLATPASADPALKPFVLASRGGGDVDAAASAARQKLQAAGFEIAGSYAPYPGAVVLAVLWVVLWTVFTLGVLVPAAAVHERGPAEAPGAQGSRSSYTFQSPLRRMVRTPGSKAIRSKKGRKRSSHMHAA